MPRLTEQDQLIGVMPPGNVLQSRIQQFDGGPQYRCLVQMGVQDIDLLFPNDMTKGTDGSKILRALVAPQPKIFALTIDHPLWGRGFSHARIAHVESSLAQARIEVEKEVRIQGRLAHHQ